MKFIIFAYNPDYINQIDLYNLANAIEKRHDCVVHVVAHQDRNAEPNYCIQMADTMQFQSNFNREVIE